MEIKNIYRIFLITIFLLGIVDFSYADSAPNIGENQAITIANNYLKSQNLPYTATTATLGVYIKNRSTGEIKFVSLNEWDTITGGNKTKPEDPNFQWDYVTWDRWWKVAYTDSQGKVVGYLMINSNTGSVSMQQTGLPVLPLILAVLLVLGGLIVPQKRK